ncbi:hypothetical protein K488DRAFT_50502 [Vararia minispora EC-137]|uniref:Uncharacterized protein n=1 Tax=Vararia minispora EC-137 TaxID=1314806 RepID=A0ACB8QJZ5_9AGAM|nr:hypothetical protein K488DRAFT_50502 [Vararia minispora EC-137]
MSSAAHAFRYMRRHFFAVEAIPLLAIVASVSAGGTWYLYRIAWGPNIVWTKKNPQPWNSIQEGETPKIMTVSYEAKKAYVRTAHGTAPRSDDYAAGRADRRDAAGSAPPTLGVESYLL